MKIELEGKIKELDFTGKIIDLMKNLGISPEEYLCIVNGEVVTEFENVGNGDNIKFVRVWSGG